MDTIKKSRIAGEAHVAKQKERRHAAVLGLKVSLGRAVFRRVFLPCLRLWQGKVAFYIG